jgi:hypothetical protein
VARRDVSGAIAILLAAASLLAGRLYYATYHRDRHALGTVVVDGTAFIVDDCKKAGVASPEAIAADLRGRGGTVLRLVREGNDVQLFYYPRGSTGAEIPVNRSDCSQWDVRFACELPSLTLVGGDVTVRCTVAGRKLDATVDFDHCRP